MRNLVFVLTLFLTVVACIPQKSYQQDAIRYFELNGTEKQYSDAIDQMFELLKKQYSSQNVPNIVWEALQNDKTASLNTIKSLLVSAYRSNFTHEDIKQLIVFYESETGKQLVKDGTQLTNDQKSELSVFYDSEVGKKVQHQNESLKMMVGEVSEQWSRNLYAETIAKLKTKGYQMP